MEVRTRVFHEAVEAGFAVFVQNEVLHALETFLVFIVLNAAFDDFLILEQGASSIKWI